MRQFQCRCGNVFPAHLGQHGCPDCDGKSDIWPDVIELTRSIDHSMVPRERIEIGSDGNARSFSESPTYG